MVNPEDDIRVASNLLHQLEVSDIAPKPDNTIREGEIELADRIISKLSRNLHTPDGYNNESFINALSACGYTLLFLVNDLFSCQLFGLQTTKGMLVIEPKR